MRARLAGAECDVHVVRDPDADLWHGIRGRRDPWFTTLCRRPLCVETPEVAAETPAGAAECVDCVNAVAEDDVAATAFASARERLAVITARHRGAR